MEPTDYKSVDANDRFTEPDLGVIIGQNLPFQRHAAGLNWRLLLNELAVDHTE